MAIKKPKTINLPTGEKVIWESMFKHLELSDLTVDRLVSLEARVLDLEKLANDYSDFLCGDGFDGKKEPKKSKWGQIIAWLGRKDA